MRMHGELLLQNQVQDSFLMCPVLAMDVDVETRVCIVAQNGDFSPLSMPA
jgi:hypothetical protein